MSERTAAAAGEAGMVRKKTTRKTVKAWLHSKDRQVATQECGSATVLTLLAMLKCTAEECVHKTVHDKPQ